MNVNMNSNLDRLKSDIIKKMVYIDTTKINIEYHKNTILIDDEFIIYSFKTPIKNLFYSGKIKPMSKITLINIDSLPRFSYPLISENQKINSNSTQNIVFNPFPLNHQVYFDFCYHYMTAPENRKSIFQNIFAIFERYKYIIATETDFNIKFILII